jgi:hypothetical protein
VSHFKERKYKNCLNCNARVYDKFCGVCGQENIEPQESVLHLLRHFFEDITHFDGKFFTSLKYLLLKPGFLTKEYVAGRRMSYLNPVRFYIFTSFLFFLIILSSAGDLSKSINKKGKLEFNTKQEDTSKQNPSYNKDTAEEEIDDSSDIKKNGDSNDSLKNNSVGLLAPVLYRDMKEFDSLIKIGHVKVGFLRKLYIYKVLESKLKFKNNKKEQAKEVLENITHYLPQALLLTLPFFAMVLRLLYIRRKRFYYVSHIIFAIHFYVFVYVQVLIIKLVSKIAELTKIDLLKDLRIILAFAIFFYIYKAMRNFYEQSRFKTIFKLCILSFFLIFLFTFFLIFLIGFSFYKT